MLRTYLLIPFLIICIMSCNEPPERQPEKQNTPPPKEETPGEFGLRTGSAPEANPLAEANQLALVILPDDTAISGKMYRFDRAGEGWSPIGTPYPVSIGKKGLAWGRGLLPNVFKRGYYKQEGDGKAPAGVFTFTRAFGYASPKEASFIKLPYLQSTDAHRCVDDAASEHYDSIVNMKDTPETWSSAEKMRRKDDLYKWGIDVKHTTQKSEGDGSCIFIHIWRGEGKPTAGCTASTEENIVELLTWLDPAKTPRLVQITQAEYPTLKAWFGLPDLPE